MARRFTTQIGFKNIELLQNDFHRLRLNSDLLLIYVNPNFSYNEYTWAPIACSVILGFGQMNKDLVDDLTSYILGRTARELNGKSEEERFETQAAIFRRLREGFLKASPLVGFPRVINALNYLQASLGKYHPNVGKALKEDKSMRASVPLSERQSRGRDFFQSTYGKQADKILASLNESSGGDLGEFAINCVYGDLISETTLVGRKETGLLQFTCCLSLGAECAPQAKGHMYGCSALGNSGEEIRNAIGLAKHLAEVFNVTWESEELSFLKKADSW